MWAVRGIHEKQVKEHMNNSVKTDREEWMIDRYLHTHPTGPLHEQTLILKYYFCTFHYTWLKQPFPKGKVQKPSYKNTYDSVFTHSRIKDPTKTLRGIPKIGICRVTHIKIPIPRNPWCALLGNNSECKRPVNMSLQSIRDVWTDVIPVTNDSGTND